MSELPGLFNDYTESIYEKPREPRSVASKIVVGGVVTGIVAAFAVIAYFGVGPMLIKPFAPPVVSSAPDVSEVLGTSQSQQYSGLIPVVDEADRKQLIQRLTSEVQLPEGEEVSVLLVNELPQHSANSLFSKAAKGDILFLAIQQRLAYVYRPSQDKIVASGEVSTQP